MASKFWGFIKSLKWRLIVMSMLLAIVPSLIVGNGILFSYEMRALSIRQSEVMGQARIIANQVATNNYLDGEKTNSDTLLTQVNMLTSIYDGRVLIVDDNFQIVYDTYNLDDNKTIISDAVIKSFKGETTQIYDEESQYIEMSLPIINPNDETKSVKVSLS